MSVGIDLGSETVRFAYFQGSKAVRLPDLDVPALVAIGPQRIVVGHEALAEDATTHSNVFHLPMRKILESEVLRHPQGGQRRMTAADAVAALISPGLEGLKKQLNTSTLKHVSFAVPEGLNSQEKKQLGVAAKAVGIANFDLVSHSVAATFQWAVESKLPSTNEKGVNVAVVNVGAAFTAISVVNMKASSSKMMAETLASRAWRFGGADIDRRLRYKAPPRVANASEAMVLKALREGKEELGEKDQTRVQVKNVAVNLNRMDIDAAAAPLVQRVVCGVGEILREMDERQLALDKTIVVGGAAKMPQIMEFIDTAFGTPESVGVEQEGQFALGAAAWAHGGHTVNPAIRGLSQVPQNAIRGHRFFAIEGNAKNNEPGWENVIPLFEDSYTLYNLPKVDTWWCIIEVQAGGAAPEEELTADDVLMMHKPAAMEHPEAVYEQEVNINFNDEEAAKAAPADMLVDFVDHGKDRDGTGLIEVGSVNPHGKGAHFGMRDFIGWRVTEINHKPATAALMGSKITHLHLEADGKLPPQAGDVEVPQIACVGWVKGGRTLQLDDAGVVGGTMDHIQFCPTAPEVSETLQNDLNRRAAVESGTKLAPLALVARATDRQPSPKDEGPPAPLPPQAAAEAAVAAAAPAPALNQKQSVKDLLAAQRQRREDMLKTGASEIKPLVTGARTEQSPPVIKRKPPPRAEAPPAEAEQTDFRTVLKKTKATPEAKPAEDPTPEFMRKKLNQTTPPPSTQHTNTTPGSRGTRPTPVKTPEPVPVPAPTIIVPPKAVADAEKKLDKLPTRTRARAVSVLQDMSAKQRKEESTKQEEQSVKSRAAVAERLRDGGGVAIDAGSTEFRMARYVKGKPKLFQEGNVPALVALSAQRTVLCGDEAIFEVSARQDNIFRYPPAKVHQAEVLAHPKGGVRLMTAGDAMAAILEKQLHRAVRHGGYVDHLSIAVPTMMNALEKKQVYHSATAAGFKSVDLIAAPVAAAIQWGVTQPGTPAAGTNCLVVDAGARFTSVSVVNVRVLKGEVQTEVRAARSFRYGGHNIDKRLKAQILGDEDLGMRDDAVYAAFADAKAEALASKEGKFQLRGHYKRITKDDVVKASKPLVRRVEAAIYSILDKMKMEAGARCDLALLLGGCGANLPGIRDLLSKRMNVEIFDMEATGQAKSWTVQGAAAWSGGAYNKTTHLSKQISQSTGNLTSGHQFFAVEGDDRTRAPTTGQIIPLFTNGVLHALPRVRGHWLIVEVVQGGGRPMLADDVMHLLDGETQSAYMDSVRLADQRKECTIEFSSTWKPKHQIIGGLSTFTGSFGTGSPLLGSPLRGSFDRRSVGRSPSNGDGSPTGGADLDSSMSALGMSSYACDDIEFREWGAGILEIESVKPGGTADKKGMRAFLGWRVTKINDIPVTSKRDIPGLFSSVTVVKDDVIPKEAGDNEVPDVQIVGVVKGGFTLQLDNNGIINEIKVPRSDEDLATTLHDDMAIRMRYECAFGKQELTKAVTRVRASCRQYSPEIFDKTIADFSHYFGIAEGMLMQAPWHARGNPGRDDDFRTIARYINAAVDTYEGKRVSIPLRDLLVKVHIAMPAAKPQSRHDLHGQDALAEVQRKLQIDQVRSMMTKKGAERICPDVAYYVRLVEKIMDPEAPRQKDAFADTELGSFAQFMELLIEKIEEGQGAKSPEASPLVKPRESPCHYPLDSPLRTESMDIMEFSTLEGLTLSPDQVKKTKGTHLDVKIAESVLHLKYPGSRPLLTAGYKARIALRDAMHRVTARHLASEDWLVLCPDAWYYINLAKQALANPFEPEVQDNTHILADILNFLVDALDRHAKPDEVVAFIQGRPVDLRPGKLAKKVTFPGRINLLRAMEKYDGFFRTGIRWQDCVTLVPDAPHYTAFAVMCLIASHSPLTDVEHSHLANFLHTLADTHQKGGDSVRSQEKMRSLEQWLWEVVPLTRPTWRGINGTKDLGRSKIEFQLTRLTSRRIKPSELTRHCAGGRHYVNCAEEISRGERQATDDECHVLGRFIGLLMDAYENPMFVDEIVARERAMLKRCPQAQTGTALAGDACLGRDRLKKILQQVAESKVDVLDLAVICPPAKTYLDIGKELTMPKKSPASSEGLKRAAGDVNLFWAQQVVHDVECYNVAKFLEGLVREHGVYAQSPTNFDCSTIEELEMWLHEVCPMTRPHGGAKLREGTGKQSLKSALARCSGKGWAPSYFITPVTRDALHYFMLAEDVVRGLELATEQEMYSLAKLLHAIMDAYVDRGLVKQVDLIETWLHEAFPKSKPGEHTSSSPRSSAKGQLARAMRRLQARQLSPNDLIGVCPNTPHYFELAEKLLADGQGSTDNANNLAVLLHAILDHYDRPGDLGTVNEREGWLHLVYPLSVPFAPKHTDTGRYQLQRSFIRLKTNGWIPEYMVKLCPYSLHYFNLGKEMSASTKPPTPEDDEQCRHLAAFLNVTMDTQEKLNNKTTSLDCGQVVVDEAQMWLHQVFPDSCPVSKQGDRGREIRGADDSGPLVLDETYASPYSPTYSGWGSQQRSRSSPAGTKRVIWEPVLREFVEVGTTQTKAYKLEEKFNQAAADIYHGMEGSPKHGKPAKNGKTGSSRMQNAPMRSMKSSVPALRVDLDHKMRKWNHTSPGPVGASSPMRSEARWTKQTMTLQTEPPRLVHLTNTSNTSAYVKLNRGMAPWEERGRSRRMASPSSTARSRSGSVGTRASHAQSTARSHSAGTASGRSTSSLTYSKPVSRPINVLAHPRMKFGAADKDGKAPPLPALTNRPAGKQRVFSHA